MIQYTYTTEAIIIFDDEFEIKIRDSLDKIVNKIEWACDEYGFTKADVVDSNTGEILIQWTEGDVPMKTQWEKNAEEVDKTYGGFVDWDEGFYQCPFCGEPRYDEDWTSENLKTFICPICEDDGDEDSESDDYDWDCDE